jgi:hypothetical protein
MGEPGWPRRHIGIQSLKDATQVSAVRRGGNGQAIAGVLFAGDRSDLVEGYGGGGRCNHGIASRGSRAGRGTGDWKRQETQRSEQILNLVFHLTPPI